MDFQLDRRTDVLVLAPGVMIGDGMLPTVVAVGGPFEDAPSNDWDELSEGAELRAFWTLCDVLG